MFTFGIFTTHMPYVIMVFFYAVYFLFTAPSSGNINDIPKPIDTGNYEWVQDYEAGYGLTISESVDYWVALESSKISVVVNHVTNLICLPPDPPGIVSEFSYHLFNRPPPHLHS